MCNSLLFYALNSAFYKSYHELQSRLVSIVSEESLKSRQELCFLLHHKGLKGFREQLRFLDLYYGHSNLLRGRKQLPNFVIHVEMVATIQNIVKLARRARSCAV